MKDIKNNWTKWLYWFLFAVAVIAVYKTLDNFNEITEWIRNLFKILMPFLIGIIIAYLLYIPSRKIESIYKKSKIKIISNKARSMSVFTVYIIAIIAIILIMKFIIPTIAQSILDLTNNLQGYYSSTMQKISEQPDDSILKNENVLKILDNLKNIDLKQYINIENLTGYAKGIINFANGIIDFFVSLIVSAYILLERAEIIKFIKKLAKGIMGKKSLKNIGKYFNRTNEIFLKFLGSQFIDAVIVGILISVAMSFMNVKYAILLGVMIGIFNMIPYFGAIIAVGIALLITLITGGLTQTIWVAIVIIILQQIDANIINPKIVGNSLKISPLLVIFAVTIGGAYFGVLGMFLAVPIFAVIKIILNDYIDNKNSEKKEKIEEK